VTADRVVYLHGFASGPDSRKARYFRRLLGEAGITVEIPDLAEGRFRELTITRQLDVLAGACGSGPVMLIGSSLGGYLAALYAARHPQVRKVVLLAPAFSFARHWTQTLGETAMDEWRQRGAMEVFHYGENATRPLGWQFIEDALRYEDSPDFRQPGLIFHGAQDAVVPVEFSRQFAAAHPNVELQMLDSGHELTDVLQVMGEETLLFLRRPAAS